MTFNPKYGGLWCEIISAIIPDSSQAYFLLTSQQPVYIFTLHCLWVETSGRRTTSPGTLCGKYHWKVSKVLLFVTGSYWEIWDTIEACLLQQSIENEALNS